MDKESESADVFNTVETIGETEEGVMEKLPINDATQFVMKPKAIVRSFLRLLELSAAISLVPPSPRRRNGSSKYEMPTSV